MEIFQPVIDVFNFIASILDTIIKGIYGIIAIITSLLDIFIDIGRILPHPLSSTFVAFLGVWSVLVAFKIFRKG